MSEKRAGKITHYFDHIKVGIIKVTNPINVGDKIHVKGHTTDFEEKIAEMQYEHENIEAAKKGQEVGVKVKEQVREGDEVFLVE